MVRRKSKSTSNREKKENFNVSRLLGLSLLMNQALDMIETKRFHELLGSRIAGARQELTYFIESLSSPTKYSFSEIYSLVTLIDTSLEKALLAQYLDNRTVKSNLKIASETTEKLTKMFLVK